MNTYLRFLGLLLTAWTLSGASPAWAGTYYVKCTSTADAADYHNSHATHDDGTPHPELDEICQYPTSQEAGVSENRCIQAQGIMCLGPAATITKPQLLP